MDINVLIAGFLMVFGSTGAAFYIHITPANRASWTKNGFVAFLTNTSGFFFGFYSIYFLGSNFGWLYGIGIWVVVAFASAFIIRKLMWMYPGVLILSLLSMGLGAFIALS